MFIRTKKTPRSQSISVQLVESFRSDGKIKQRVVRHIGTAETPEKLEELKQLAYAIKTELIHQQLSQKVKNSQSKSAHFLGQLQKVSEETLLHATALEESQRYILGIHDIYGFIYDQLGFTNLFSRPNQRTYAAGILREIVLMRIACPGSKRASVEILREKFGFTINLDHVYQMMDKIDGRFCERIQQAALAMTLKLSSEKLRVMFYDATTLYFESFKEDSLKQNGYSKDMKFNQPQVLLALFVTEKGLPVGYELFPGATFEGHTLIPVLEKLKKRYLLDEIVFVADRGMLSKENFQYLEENNFKYIVGARIKNVSKTLKAKILNRDNYSKINEETNQAIASFTVTDNKKLIVNFSEERAKKDQYDREKSVARLYKKLAKSKDPKSLLNNYGYKKYIKLQGKSTLNIDQEKLANECLWDGLLGVYTNHMDMNVKEVLGHYRNLWQVEECFRINKHDLSIRPVYHWTPTRIKAHIAIAFIAFVCVRYLEYRLSVQSKKLSPEIIRQSLLKVQASIIRDHKLKQDFLLPSKINSNALEIYRIFRMQPPHTIMALKRSA